MGLHTAPDLPGQLQGLIVEQQVEEFGRSTGGASTGSCPPLPTVCAVNGPIGGTRRDRARRVSRHLPLTAASADEAN
jgi:hypothetical protein